MPGYAVTVHGSNLHDDENMHPGLTAVPYIHVPQVYGKMFVWHITNMTLLASVTCSQEDDLDALSFVEDKDRRGC